ncbi:MAG: type II/IV secretion system ATPase subunit [Candidatus Caldarchaeum sp.]
MDWLDILTGVVGSIVRLVTASLLNMLLTAAAVGAVVLAVFLVLRRRRMAEGVVLEQVEEEKPKPVVLEEYMVDNLINVKVLSLNGRHKYIVEEPSLTEEEKIILQKVEQAYVIKGEDPFKILERFRIPEDRLESVKYYVFKNLKGGWKLEPLLRDEGLEDITATKPGPVYVIHRRHPDLGWIETNIELSDKELDKQALLLAERNGAELNIARPAAEIMTSDGDRIALTYAGELTPGTSTITIRKFPRHPYTIIDLIRKGTLNTITAAYLWTFLENKKFVVIAGPTGSGKTTLLAALLQLLPSNAKILTLEDYHPEINLTWHKNWHRFVTRRTLGETAYSLAEILRLSLRHRPDYTVVGEVRGQEARVMFSAAATGHGMASTLHAESIEDVYQRFSGASMGVMRDELVFLNVVALIKGTPKGRRVVGVWEVEKPGKEHLISWYDEESGRFFPETSRQLMVNSFHLVRSPSLRRQYEANLKILEELVLSGESIPASEISVKVEEMRKGLKLVVS